MHTEIFNNIDTLMNMANSPLSIEEINTELITLNKNIKNKKNEIEDLKSLMVDNRYFSASNELVDKNIEISLKNKINRLNHKIKALTETINEITSREKRIHNDITALNEKINSNESYITILENKVNTATNKTYYETLLNKEKESMHKLTQELTNKKNLYNEILKELELNNQAKEELSENLHTEEARLNDVLDNLNNPKAYIDEDLKNADNEKLEALSKELEAFEKRRMELLTNANMVGADAKELIINNNIPEALNKIKELVNIVKKEPYMDITTESILDEELEKKESLREELSSLIDNKNYEALDSNALNNRINYIKEAISSNSAIIEKYQNEINSIDEFVNSTLSTAITDLENELLALEKSLTEAHNLLKENKIPRTKANLESTITKKEKERDILNNILNSYKENLISKIASTNKLEEFITLNRDENEKLSLELEKLNKLSLLDLKTRDLVHEEEDKEKLKALNEEIKALKNRQKFSKTPDEIFDEIDMYLASLKSSEPVKEPLNSQPERLKVVEIIPVETVKAETGGN